ncbi:coenzyme PQQ synthesis protein D (PqqD) [Nocardiopsis sp. Huas11]|uniref:PqqD family protein n=1 Tax=Nocardiopsis sp. Huas11 TaxID=2183912 RepID=UPI000F24A9E4|nr:PqqD family protein [Nocardiopsis sp. Huas11]RKS04999.1 coenzyme PQQ synthesis protein D (PqqD) [Nocardiopsis sp. Huas11]
MNNPRLAAEIQHTGDHAVVVPACADARVLVVNPVAAAILEQCDGTATIEEITTQITAHYDADRDQVHTDVINLLKAVDEHGLLRSSAQEGSTATAS